MAVNWDYYEAERFEELDNIYLPATGEGETMATQAVTALNKLIFKWYNDGDVYDNTYLLSGWCNDLSSYANWLHKNIPEVGEILEGIAYCQTEGDYEDMLQTAADVLFDGKYLEELNQKPATGTIYKCDGVFRWVEEWEEDW